MVRLLILFFIFLYGSVAGIEYNDFHEHDPRFFMKLLRSLQKQELRQPKFRCPKINPTNRFEFGSDKSPYDNATYSVHITIQQKSGKTTQCNGILFNPSLILTCAHCWDNAQTDMPEATVYAGIENGQTVANGISRKVKSLVIHPAYQFFNGTAFVGLFDLAVVEVDPKFEFMKGTLAAIGFPRIEQPNFTSDRWVECQFAGNIKDKCLGTWKRIYMTGILTSVSCCDHAKNQMGNPPEIGTICLLQTNSQTDAQCAADNNNISGSGVVCKYAPSGERVVVGLLRAVPNRHANLSHGNRPSLYGHPIDVVYNVVPLDMTRRKWISRVALTHSSCGFLTYCPSAKSLRAQKLDFMDRAYL